MNGETDAEALRPKFVSRAEIMSIRTGIFHGDCAHCDEAIKGSTTRKGAKMVVCNVYDDAGKWERLEKFHAPCYTDAEMPHGLPGENAAPKLSPEEVRTNIEVWDQVRAAAEYAAELALEQGTHYLPHPGEGSSRI